MGNIRSVVNEEQAKKDWFDLTNYALALNRIEQKHNLLNQHKRMIIARMKAEAEKSEKISIGVHMVADNPDSGVSDS